MNDNGRAYLGAVVEIDDVVVRAVSAASVVIAKPEDPTNSIVTKAESDGVSGA